MTESKYPITIICGHYGSGKTNLCLNLALESAEKGIKTVVVDLDIVNPYFRTSEYKDMLENKGIKVITPNYANTTLDTPSLPAEIYSVFGMSNTKVFIDVGGDDAGATALGTVYEELSASDFEMIYVINKYRILSSEPEEAAVLLSEIQQASRLKATGIVNNSHLGVDTELKTCLDSIDFANKVSELTGLDILYSTVPDFAAEGKILSDGFKTVERLVLFPWEMAENN